MSDVSPVGHSRYLVFEQTADTGKTKKWAVRSRSGGYLLARIAWYGPWRQYTLFPEPDTVWNIGCLNDINDFIAAQHAARRKATASV